MKSSIQEATLAMLLARPLSKSLNKTYLVGRKHFSKTAAETTIPGNIFKVDEFLYG